MFMYGKMLPALALMGVLGLSLTPEAVAQTAGNLVCKKCVGKGDLARNAVTGSKIKKNAVTGAKIKNGSVAFNDLKPAVRQLIADLQSRVAALEAQAGFVSDLAAVVTLDEVETDLDGNGTIDPASEVLPRVLFEGVNVQVVNGDMSEATNSRNGLGNLIVGYNEPRTGGGIVCSAGEITDELICVLNGHVWALDHKSGSHNLVVGPENTYSQTGGVVFGDTNVVNRTGASVTGGSVNTASGLRSSVSGGVANRASGESSSVSGGFLNTASGGFSSVNGDDNTTVSGACDWGGKDMVFGDGSCF